MTYPAAENIAELLGMDEQEAEFVEVMLWYDGFKDQERLQILPYSPDDVRIIHRKMESSRGDKDFRTADTLREVLRNAGIVVKNRIA